MSPPSHDGVHSPRGRRLRDRDLIGRDSRLRSGDDGGVGALAPVLRQRALIGASWRCSSAVVAEALAVEAICMAVFFQVAVRPWRPLPTPSAKSRRP